jgi:hypothetical protein
MVYVRAMQQRKCGDPKILAAITQISELHRNPLIHPEDILTLDEAMALVGIARSAMSAMLVPLPVIPPKTTSVGVGQPA